MTRQSRDCAKRLQGTVVRVRRGRCDVQIVHAPPECEGCKACSIFHKKDRIVPAKTDRPYAVGDTVELLAPESRPILAMLLLFLLPIAGLLTGFMIAVLAELPELYGLMCALGGLMLGFLAVLLIDRLVLSDRYRYKIVQQTNEIQAKENIDG